MPWSRRRSAARVPPSSAPSAVRAPTRQRRAPTLASRALSVTVRADAGLMSLPITATSTRAGAAAAGSRRREHQHGAQREAHQRTVQVVRLLPRASGLRLPKRSIAITSST